MNIGVRVDAGTSVQGGIRRAAEKIRPLYLARVAAGFWLERAVNAGVCGNFAGLMQAALVREGRAASLPKTTALWP
jgi:hypothetical protein